MSWEEARDLPCCITGWLPLLFWVFIVDVSTGTPFWKLILKQFDDLLVKILIAAAIVSFLLAIVNGETGVTAFVEPSVSCPSLLTNG
jgi:magnesium-transporting ATPase (P-type)